jgi:hypothetical protein
MSVTLFPNVLEPATALKAYAPVGVKFWENQETALEGLKEFADGWFARRHKSTQAALEAAKHIGDAATPSDVFREYQNWLARAMDGPIRAQVDRYFARLRSRRGIIQGSRGSRIALSINDRGASTRRDVRKHGPASALSPGVG